MTNFETAIIVILFWGLMVHGLIYHELVKLRRLLSLNRTNNKSNTANDK